MRVDSYVFFFQAEDGIRDVAVTGVQTCALPISPSANAAPPLGPTTKCDSRTSYFLWCALQDSRDDVRHAVPLLRFRLQFAPARRGQPVDRKSTRLNSSHGYISYAVFCLKKNNQTVDH